eukprot:GHVP01053565.1.p1 GENE.GHVP01053565.1~~GHVP01053565.1.p1  ORF type:complete len:148 (+),score=17.32 GHVP01053565.1:1-444(+)
MIMGTSLNQAHTQALLLFTFLVVGTPSPQPLFLTGINRNPMEAIFGETLFFMNLSVILALLSHLTTLLCSEGNLMPVACHLVAILVVQMGLLNLTPVPGMLGYEFLPSSCKRFLERGALRHANDTELRTNALLATIIVHKTVRNKAN